jgi:hypothetical protein
MRRVCDCETNALGFLRQTRLGDAARHKQDKKSYTGAVKGFHEETFEPESVKTSRNPNDA